jgi:hypothetical protein
MPALLVRISAEDLRARVRHRLLNGAPASAPTVVWTDDDAEVVVHVGSLDLRLTDGWLLVDVPLETRETGKTNVRCVYFLGREGRGDGLTASCTVDPRASAVLIGRWGDPLLTAIWSGVQDVLEGAYQAAKAAFPKDSPALVGYAADEGSIRIAMTR